MLSLAPKIILWIVALFYAYGALVHVLNMASLTGFAWPDAPLKWQALDIFYLVIDIVVVVGLLRRRTYGFVAFYIAAISQILLYTLFQDWIVDVPAEFALSSEQVAYLDSLVVFHAVTVVLVGIAAYQLRSVGD